MFGWPRKIDPDMTVTLGMREEESVPAPVPVVEPAPTIQDLAMLVQTVDPEVRVKEVLAARREMPVPSMSLFGNVLSLANGQFVRNVMQVYR